MGVHDPTVRKDFEHEFTGPLFGRQGFSATTLTCFQKYSGVPCMRAALRAVFSANRSPRPAPADPSSDRRFPVDVVAKLEAIRWTHTHE